MSKAPIVSVVIPTLNGARTIDSLLRALEDQIWRPNEIIVVDSSSTDSTVGLALSHKLVHVISIERSDFNHGATRNMAFNQAHGDFVFFLTQDALPSSNTYISNLMEPFHNENIALAYGRQIARPDAKRYVQLVQEFNYPDKALVKNKNDVDRLGIKAYFCSDVCSAYRRESLEDVGGIPSPCSTNEDMLAAARLIQQGYSVAYVPSASVIHSHNFTPLEQYKRNKEIGLFLHNHAEELSLPSEVGEGKKLAKTVLQRLIKESRYAEAIDFIVDCSARLIGNRVGKLG